MDMFPRVHRRSSCSLPDYGSGWSMGYYDGNTVTGALELRAALRDERQLVRHRLRPSTPGALNLVSGQTHGATPAALAASHRERDRLIGDPDPALRRLLRRARTIAMTRHATSATCSTPRASPGAGSRAVSRRPARKANGKAVCGASHTQHRRRARSPTTAPTTSRSSTTRSPPTRTTCRPLAPAMIGHADQANHQYDLADFYAPSPHGNLPACQLPQGARVPGRPRRLLRPARRADVPRRHASTHCSSSPDWNEHGGRDRLRRLGRLVRPSDAPDRQPVGVGGGCAQRRRASAAIAGKRRGGYRGSLRLRSAAAAAGRSRRGRSATSSTHSITDQTSILRFIEDNWGTGRIGDGSFDANAGSLNDMFHFDRPRTSGEKLFLSETTGEPVHGETVKPGHDVRVISQRRAHDSGAGHRIPPRSA